MSKKHPIFDPKSRLNKLRSGFDQLAKLRGRFLWAADKKNDKAKDKTDGRLR